MSTPPGTSLDHTDPCADEPLEPQQSAGSKAHSVDNDAVLQSAYAVANTYAQPAVETCSCINQEFMRFPATEGLPEERGGTEYVHSEKPLLRGAIMHGPEVDRDARRLAASVRWVEREEIAARLRLAGLMPSVSPFVPLDVRGNANGEIDNGSSSRLREADSGMPPSAMSVRRDPLHTSLVVLTVSTSILLASIFTGAYYVSRSPPGSQIGSLDSRVATLPTRSSTQQTFGRIIARDDSGMLSNSEIFDDRLKSWAATKPIAQTAVATVPPGTPGIQEPSSSTTVNSVGSTEDNAFFMKQGVQFIAAGDVLAARNSFRQAAEAGHRDAAIALGATYDHTLLAALGAVGIDVDDAKARSWYERAEKLGSPNARLRLDSNGGR